MDTVNTWLSAILAACGVIAAVAAMLRVSFRTMLNHLDDRIGVTVEAAVERTFDEKFDKAFDRKFDEKFDEAFDRKFDEKFSKGFDEKFGVAVQPIYQRLDGIDTRLAGIDKRLAGIDTRLDGIDTRIDHVTQVLDLRIRPIEADMSLVKQRLLGTPAA